jgi:RNA-splicing ligase RtcB
MTRGCQEARAEKGCPGLFGMAPDPASEISCVHKFVRREIHLGEEVWVHRKGAISARLGEPGIVPGSMGTPTFHVGAADTNGPSAPALMVRDMP